MESTNDFCFNGKTDAQRPWDSWNDTAHVEISQASTIPVSCPVCSCIGPIAADKPLKTLNRMLTASPVNCLQVQQVCSGLDEFGLASGFPPHTEAESLRCQIKFDSRQSDAAQPSTGQIL